MDRMEAIDGRLSMARGIWPSMRCACRAGLLLAALAATATRAQESGMAPADAAAPGEALPLRLTHGTSQPAGLQRRLDSVVAGTLAVTAPRRGLALDGTASEPGPAVRPAAWHSGLGLTLSGGDRIGVRRADGGLQLVWRRQF